ncbi:hypothetical protein B7494_g1105 [Chlorociboria aeruginascens]|nr:hypothetical protein B7494_g1105 [Chlorociboria aeruginascens]
MMSNVTKIPPHEPITPLPTAYNRQVAYDSTKNQYYSLTPYTTPWDLKCETASSSTAELRSLDVSGDIYQEISTGKPRKSLMLWLRDCKIIIRALAIVILIISVAMILTAVTQFENAKQQPNHPLNTIPQQAPVTDTPCLVFSGVAALNLIFSITLLVFACVSSKFKKSTNAITACFTIVSAVGFASSMGACFFLNKRSTLSNDLWSWSCGNHKKGISSEVLNFNLICHVVNYGWTLGLVQAALDLLTFLMSIVAWIILKWSYFNESVFGSDVINEQPRTTLKVRIEGGKRRMAGQENDWITTGFFNRDSCGGRDWDAGSGVYLRAHYLPRSRVPENPRRVSWMCVRKWGFKVRCGGTSTSRLRCRAMEGGEGKQKHPLPAPPLAKMALLDMRLSNASDLGPLLSSPLPSPPLPSSPLLPDTKWQDCSSRTFTAEERRYGAKRGMTITLAAPMKLSKSEWPRSTETVRIPYVLVLLGA